MAVAASETLNIRDGTTMEIARLPDVDDATWTDVKAYVEGNPDTAKALQKFVRSPNVMRGWLQTQAIAEHYSTRLTAGDADLEERLVALEQDPELAHVFEDIQKSGLKAAMRHYHDEELLLKISERMGGMPEELGPALRKIDETPLSLHEAAKAGDLKAVQEFRAKQRPLDLQDHRGITPLGYAVGSNRAAVAKLLLESKADQHAVDSAGNSALHYAAGYGRAELLEFLLQAGAVVHQTNAKGETPLAVATLNGQEATMELLKAKGGS